MYIKESGNLKVGGMEKLSSEVLEMALEIVSSELPHMQVSYARAEPWYIPLVGAKRNIDSLFAVLPLS